MVKIIIDILLFVIFWICGYACCSVFNKSELIGNLLIVKQENEEPVLLLEVNKGKKEEIVPGRIVQLKVEEYEREET